MKRALLLIVVPALLVALGFAQTPATGSNTDQTTIKGCLGGSDGNYTVVEDNTGHIFKIATSSVDLKPHLNHDVTLIGHKASAASSTAAGNSFAITELSMISEHCAAVAAASTAPVTTPSETASTPAADATAPAATASTPAADATAPAATASTPAANSTAPAATVAPPAETVSTPAADATAPVATVSTHPETDGRPAARPRRRSETPAVAAAPTVTASSPSENAGTPAAAAITPVATDSSPSEPVSTPAAVATPPTATSKGWSLMLLIAFGVLVVVIGTMFPFVSRWRKQKSLERTGAPNLSFSRETSSDRSKSDQGKSDEPRPRKAA
ncbi:MAG: hypothetical protein WCA20_04740 [Candidatus Sulfotelmatobacter sp.]